MDRDTLYQNSIDEKSLRELEELDLADALSKYNELILDLYWKKKDVTAVIEVGRMAFKLAEKRGERNHQALSPLGYNIGSFTLPWWSDSLDVTEEQAKYGLETSKRTLEIRESMGADAIKISGIKWLIAGHYLYTLKKREMAIIEFGESKKIALDTEDEKRLFMDACTDEGIGRTEGLLGDKGTGENYLRSAEKKYTDLGDDYNIGEVRHFLKQIEN